MALFAPLDHHAQHLRVIVLSIMALTGLVACQATTPNTPPQTSTLLTTEINPTINTKTASESTSQSAPTTTTTTTPTTIRVATFNANLTSNTPGLIAQALENKSIDDALNTKFTVIAEIIQRVKPDILLINELDAANNSAAIKAFQTQYLQKPWNYAQTGTPSEPIEFTHTFSAPVNTGELTGLDLDQNGSTTQANDAHGYGQFPGQYGMLVLSRYPIYDSYVRTFQNLIWSSMPGHLMPTDWYSPQAVKTLRLSSKSHWDIPIQIRDNQTLHLLAAHPTPPTFDGPEDRNGRRNHDEIRLWADYISADTDNATNPANIAKPTNPVTYLIDDQGKSGGLNSQAHFVILGDYNADPQDGDSYNQAINQLLNHPRIQDPKPKSLGGIQDAQIEAKANQHHQTNPALDTGDFNPGLPNGPGNLRVDYVLPSSNLTVINAGVFWPDYQSLLSKLVADTPTTYPFIGSDHRLVWVDIQIPVTDNHNR